MALDILNNTTELLLNKRSQEDVPKADLSITSPEDNLELPNHNFEIEKVKTIRRDDLSTQFGYYFERHITMSDGERHREIIGISRHKNAEKLVVSIPAWWTSPITGINKLTSDKLHQRGLHTITKGVSENRASSLSRGAADLHASLNYDDGFKHNYSADSVLVHGDSNGAMQGTGFIAYANKHNRIVEDAFLVDPCLVHKLNYNDIKKFIKHPSYLPKEIFNIGRQALRMAFDPNESVSSNLATIEPSTGYIIGNLLLSKALFSGEFGVLLAHIPAEQRAHYLLFKHSIANQKKDFIKQIGSKTKDTNANITTETRTGSHLSIANPRTIKDKLDYLSTHCDS